ncbi:hypothetical protein DPQ22_02430 [Candidatus Tokpelaia sp.]|nr:hypothetical protein DPQ22_02430 [Candidatus Tokpelaia sp.]
MVLLLPAGGCLLREEIRHRGGVLAVISLSRPAAVIYYPVYCGRLLQPCRAGSVLYRDRFVVAMPRLAPDILMLYHKACAAAGLLRACGLCFCKLVPVLCCYIPGRLLEKHLVSALLGLMPCSGRSGGITKRGNYEGVSGNEVPGQPGDNLFQ